MTLFGAHMSIAGGYYKAIEEAHEAGCDCVQLFTKNNNQWRAKPITEEEVTLFQEKLRALGITRPLAHASYLLNLASPNDELWDKSVDALVIEWQRAEQLGLDGVVIHPGSYTESSEEEGLEKIAKGLKQAWQLAKPKNAWVLLENTAGQGTNLGWKLEHLAFLLEKTGAAMNIGVCIDTCHAHAAGYDLSTSEGLKKLIRDAKATNVLAATRAIHLNDSLKGAGSRVDRHEHLGKGTITEMGLARFIQSSAFKKLPMYLETNKGEAPDGRDWDVVNLETARRLATMPLTS